MGRKRKKKRKAKPKPEETSASVAAQTMTDTTSSATEEPLTLEAIDETLQEAGVLTEPEKEVEEPIIVPVAAVSPYVIIHHFTEAIEELPEASQNLTRRWYGETFLPAYNVARNKLRQLAGLT